MAPAARPGGSGSATEWVSPLFQWAPWLMLEKVSGAPDCICRIASQLSPGEVPPRRSSSPVAMTSVRPWIARPESAAAAATGLNQVCTDPVNRTSGSPA